MAGNAKVTNLSSQPRLAVPAGSRWAVRVCANTLRRSLGRCPVVLPVPTPIMTNFRQSYPRSSIFHHRLLGLLPGDHGSVTPSAALVRRTRRTWTRHPPDGGKRAVGGRRAAGPLVVVLLGVVTVLLAACGGSPSSGVANVGSTGTTSAGSGPQTAVAGAVRFASCMRSNGVTDYPDPANSGRPQSLNGIDSNSPTFQTAFEACRKYASNGVGAPPEPSPAELRVGLAFARCVRMHGFPQFPDPLTTVSLQATFTLGRGMYFLINGTYHVMSPAFMHAAKACGVQL
jgi:hypothetical protein